MNENHVISREKVKVYTLLGDITKIPSPAIMTAINSDGLWFGGVDGAIQRVAGNHYHSQAADQMPLRNLQTVVAKGNRKNHSGKFDDVIFVIDDLQSPLEEVVYAGLETAHKEGYETLLVPSVRMGVMLGAVEKTPEEAAQRIGKGVLNFTKKYGKVTKLQNVKFVVYNDTRTIVKELNN